MPNPPTAKPKDACPHCGRPTGLTMLEVLPSRDNKRFFVCKGCGGKFAIANNSKMAALMCGMMGMALGVLYPFNWIVKAGGATKLSIITGICAVILCVLGAATAAARITLSLEAR